MLFDKLQISNKTIHIRYRSWNGEGDAIYVFAQNWVRKESMKENTNTGECSFDFSSGSLLVYSNDVSLLGSFRCGNAIGYRRIKSFFLLACFFVLARFLTDITIANRYISIIHGRTY